MTDSLSVGRSVAEADSHALDLDDDARHTPDNALGHVFAALSNLVDVDGAIAASLAAGDVVILHSLRADSLVRDPTASWSVYLGEPEPEPVLTGGGSFTVDPAAPASSKIVGAVARGRFAGERGTIPLRLGLVPG